MSGSGSRRGRGRKDARPPVEVSIPESRRVTALGAAFRRAFRPHLIVANTAGAVVGFGVIVLLGQPGIGIPLLLRVPAAIGAFAVVACGLLPFLVRGRLRAGLESFAWIGRWDALRWRDSTGGRPPASPEQARAWLEANPVPGDAPPVERLARIEPLLMVGDVESARKVAAGLPATSPWDRFESAYQQAYVGFAAGGRVDPRPLAAAVRAIPDDDERTHAEALVAVGKARLALADGKDWLAPLEEVRPTIGARADGVLRLEVWPALFRLEIVVAIVAGAVLALVVTLG